MQISWSLFPSLQFHHSFMISQYWWLGNIHWNLLSKAMLEGSLRNCNPASIFVECKNQIGVRSWVKDINSLGSIFHCSAELKITLICHWNSGCGGNGHKSGSTSFWLVKVLTHLFMRKDGSQIVLHTMIIRAFFGWNHQDLNGIFFLKFCVIGSCWW